MKKHGALNSEIDKLLADLGHTDQLTIGTWASTHRVKKNRSGIKTR